MNNYLHFIKQTTFKCKHPKAIYKCICGTEKEIAIGHVKSGHTKSCGCMSSRKTIGDKSKIHGLSRKHPLYGVWNTMKSRCYNKNSHKYKNYGAIGVKVCDEWMNNFASFYKWAIENGWKNGLQIDKDINGNGLLYSPETCVITTSKENNNNRKNNNVISYNGETKTISQWSDILGIKSSTISARIRIQKWDIKKALNKSLMKNQYG